LIESTFDSCLLHIEFIEFTLFGIVDLQTDDTLILADDEFVALEENELIRAYLIFKKREKLNLIISIKFNDELIILVNDNNALLLTQSKQFDQIKLINLTFSISLAVELGFGQKFKPDPRVDVRPNWTDQSSQPDPRVGVRRILPSLSETSYI
jgi:hypothetical protein